MQYSTSSRSTASAPGPLAALGALLLLLTALGAPAPRALAQMGPPSPYICVEGQTPPHGWVPVGDPIDVRSGAMMYSQTDMAVDGPVPLALSRHHNTHSAGTGVFGPGSSIGYDLRVIQRAGGGATGWRGR